MIQVIHKQTARRRVVQAAYILLVLAVSLSVFPVQGVQAAACKFKHKVEPGETLIYIGQLYQYDWQKIAEANNLKEPYILTPGTKLCIPGGEKPTPTTTVTTNADGTTTTKAKTPTLTVGPGINHVYIKVENFPKFMVYNVRIYPIAGHGWLPPNAPLPPAGVAEYVIGRIRTNKNGFYEEWMRIPNYVPRHYVMVLCLKNVWTDHIGCLKYDNPWVDIVLEEYPSLKRGR
jgi:LysM repeat protein